MTLASAFAERLGEGWPQIAQLALAFVLSSMIGLEREVRQKSAGMRTHAIVGTAAALFIIVSKHGFADVLGTNVVVDPSRVAAGVVTGIGFIGGGLIFVRRDAVRGLTTAAVVWLTAAVGMAAGAGLPILAVLVTAAHFIVVYGYTPLVARIPRSKYSPSQLVMTYVDAMGVLRKALSECTDRGFSVVRVATERPHRLSPPGQPGKARGHEDAPELPEQHTVSVVLQVQGTGSVTQLAASLSEIDGMVTVNAEATQVTAE